LRRLWDEKGKYLIVGSRTARDLWGELADRHCFQFASEQRIGFGRESKVIGLQVVIVPWIEEGLFVLPELKVMQAA